MTSKFVPSAQQLLAAIAGGLRLSDFAAAGVPAPSQSTRKSFAAGKRVKPATRHEYAFWLAAALNDAQLLTPLRRTTSEMARQNDDAVARGIGEFALAWDECASDARTYNSAATESCLSVLPFVRLGLAELAIRLACRNLGRRSYWLLADLGRSRDALVGGAVFMENVRYLLEVAEVKRARLVDALSPELVRAWEAGALPQAGSIEKLRVFFEQHANLDAGVELDLRLSVALAELWQWLESIGVPQVARSRMADGFLSWTRTVAALMVQAEIAAEDLEWGVVRGARHPEFGLRLGSLASNVPSAKFAADLRALSGSWTARVRVDTGGLVDIALAASDQRAALPVDHPDARLADEELLAANLCLPSNPFEAPVRRAEDEGTASTLEAQGTAALNMGDFATAERSCRGRRRKRHRRTLGRACISVARCNSRGDSSTPRMCSRRVSRSIRASRTRTSCSEACSSTLAVRRKRSKSSSTRLTRRSNSPSFSRIEGRRSPLSVVGTTQLPPARRAFASKAPTQNAGPSSRRRTATRGGIVTRSTHKRWSLTSAQRPRLPSRRSTTPDEDGLGRYVVR